MQKLFIFICFIFIANVSAQIDSLRIGDRYLEDQLYANITYNVLLDRPFGEENRGFSYGLSAGYVRDIPFNKSGNFAMGIGVGYNYDVFTHSLQVVNTNEVTYNTGVTANKIYLHNIEFPIQFRWRTSDAVTYSFWRIYTGVRLSYNLRNSFSYELNDVKYEFKNINVYNNFQYGLELNAGYGAFNFFVYYGLQPMFNDVNIDGVHVNTKITKFGISFFLL